LTSTRQASAQVNAHKQVGKQALLMPLAIEVSLSERLALETMSETLGAFGFDIVSLGGNTFALHTIPVDLTVHSPQELFKDILGDLVSEETQGALSLQDKKKKIILSVSCRSAIKFGDPLTGEELRMLLEILERTPNNQSCIHGRPVFYRVSLDELAKWFKRR
jgi:DNA mismatch repair protein MutL